MTAFIHFLLVFAAAVLLVASLTPYMKSLNAEVDLPSHFSLQYALGAAGLAILGGLFHAPGLFTLLLFGAMMASLVQFLRFVPFGRNDPHPDTAPAMLRVLQANVLKLNRDAARLQALIAKENPHLVVIAEFTEAFQPLLREIYRDYPYQMADARGSSYGMAVASKLPLYSQQQLTLDGPDKMAMAFRLMHDGKEIEFLSMHPATPNRDIASRNREFDNAVAHFGARRGNIVVLGDLNATPYCAALKKLCRRLNLKNAREGHSLGGSFPVFLPTPFLRIPIDHVLLGENLHADQFKLGPDIGSDHFPTITAMSHVTH